MHVTPYSTPSSLDTVTLLEQRISRHVGRYLPVPFFRTAEIFACLQTLDDAIREMETKSRHRQLAAQTWRELTGDLVANIPVLLYNNQDPFSVARQDFTPSTCPGRFRNQLEILLTHMVRAANAVIGGNQRYVSNYHGVICYQLSRLELLTPQACSAYHRDVLHMPEPNDAPHSCLVYPPNYAPDHMPRGSEDHYDLTDFETPIHKKIKTLKSQKS